MAVTVTLPDGTPLELPDGATGADAAAAIGAGLARAALAVEVSGDGIGNSEVRDLARPLPDGARISILTQRSGAPALALIRHDAAHVLAESVLELYPGVQISIGPAIDEGFYYDFEFPAGTSVSEHDFPRIEERMREHIKAAELFERDEVPVEEARERFVAERQDYKVELIDDLLGAARAGGGEPLRAVSLYTNGRFTDLCRGPHAPSTASIGAFRLQSIAGAYWRGDSTRTMLTRIYGTAFFSKKELDEYLERLEQARLRDHRRLGRELDLFTFSELSPGAALWLPAGTTVYNGLVGLSRRMTSARGFTEVKTPQVFDAELWKTSGHWGKFREHMFTFEIEGREAAVKPMNCPAHCLLFSTRRHSYRELPVRYFEPGLLHRNEASGVLHGLLRVRHFSQDDGHIFCAEEQVSDEVRASLQMAFETYRLFDFHATLELSTRPEQRIGGDELWDRAEGALAAALDAEGLEYELNPGDGAFYGPKIDMHVTDSLGRSWQLGTVQLDYSMPERFGLTYTGADNAEHTPVLIHRAMFGSYERFIGILLEHFGGELPVWLTPVQALVVPVSDRFNDYAASVRDELLAAGLRVEIDGRSESVSRKVRDAELRKAPYILVVGEREQGEGTVSVRARGPFAAAAGEPEEATMSVQDLGRRVLAQL